MARPTQMSVLVPTHYRGDLPAPADFVKWFQAVEELGFSTVWILDPHLQPVQGPRRHDHARLGQRRHNKGKTRHRRPPAPSSTPHPACQGSFHHRLPLRRAPGPWDRTGGTGSRVPLIGHEARGESASRFRENLAAMRAIWSGPDAAYRRPVCELQQREHRASGPCKKRTCPSGSVARPTASSSAPPHSPTAGSAGPATPRKSSPRRSAR